jgi:hypothetical protein
MASTGDKLAQSLEKLKELQDRGFVSIKADDLSRGQRERLVRMDLFGKGLQFCDELKIAFRQASHFDLRY